MSTNNMPMAMFLQQRLQILDLGSQGKITPSYVYAWEHSIYPYHDDTDGSVVKHPHELYNECFLANRSYVKRIYNTLCFLKDRDKQFTFWELEDHLENQAYDQIIDRPNLIAICTYFRLKGLFSDKFWQHLVLPQQSPSESGSILDDYDPVTRQYEYFI